MRAGLRGWPAIRVIARREILERGRDRSTAISTLVTIVILAAIVVIPAALGLGDDPKVDVAASGQRSAGLADAARTQQEPFGVRITVQRVGDDRAATQAVDDGDADVAVLRDGTALKAADDAEDGALAALQAASAQQRTTAELAGRGIRPGTTRALLNPTPLPVAQSAEDDASGLAFVVLLVLYGQLLAYGYVVASGVVEEKQSRIVELVLSAIRPRDLLAGKVLGIGVVGVVQLLVIGVVGLVLSAVTGRLDVGGAGVPGALGIALAWFLLGFALYATAYAMAGALVSRAEDLQSSTTPITMAVIGSFLLSFAAVDDPSGPLAQILSFIPLSAPLVMPVRMVGGGVAAWEVLLSVLVMLVAIALLVSLAGRVYGNAVLRTGGRVKLAAALKG
jgi:ABC-2 type transport system permease protein